MRSIVICLLIVFSLTGAAYANNAATSDNPQMRIDWFITTLKDITDRHELENPDKIGQRLQLKLQSEGATLDGHAITCKKPERMRGDVDTAYTIKGQSWVHAQTGGIPHMEISGFMGQKPGRLSDPTFNYDLKNTMVCVLPSEQHRPEATLIFDNFPAYACLTREALQKALPAAKWVDGTDGVGALDYTNATKDGLSTGIEFLFYSGADCAIRVSAGQEDYHPEFSKSAK